MLLEMLADGRLHLSAIAKIAPHLTPENRDALLRRATHKTRREVEELVAELAPRPDVADSIRKLPAGRLVARVGPTSRATPLPAEDGRQGGPWLDAADAGSCLTVPGPCAFDQSMSPDQPNVPIVPLPEWVKSIRSDASHASAVTTAEDQAPGEPTERTQAFGEPTEPTEQRQVVTEFTLQAPGEANVQEANDRSGAAPKPDVRWIPAPATRPAAIEAPRGHFYFAELEGTSLLCWGRTLSSCGDRCQARG